MSECIYGETTLKLKGTLQGKRQETHRNSRNKIRPHRTRPNQTNKGEK